jgi:hypothetical protein
VVDTEVVMMEVFLSDKQMSYEDGKQKFIDADLWAVNICSTYKGYHVQDVSDFSPDCDQIALYLFESEEEAAWFKLRWL